MANAHSVAIRLHPLATAFNSALILSWGATRWRHFRGLRFGFIVILRLAFIFYLVVLVAITMRTFRSIRTVDGVTPMATPSPPLVGTDE